MSLSLEVYSSGSTLLLPDDYRNATQITYDGFYPGGLFGQATFFVPREPARMGLIRPGMRVKIRSGNVTTWEGYVSARELITEEIGSGIKYTCLGAWGYILDGTLINKPWAETRISEDVWLEPIVAYNANDLSLKKLASVDRQNRLRINPSSARDAAGTEIGWRPNDYYRLQAIAPTGQTWKRIGFSYNMQEATFACSLGIYNTSSSTIELNITASATSTTDITLATPTQELWFYFQNASASTEIMPSDDTVFGEISDVTLYTETGAINSTEIGKDIIGMVTACSSAETGIGSNTFSLVPFVAENITAAQVLMNAASYGDSSFNSWAFYIRESDLSPDDKPILYYAQQPALTSAEYYIRLEDQNLQAPVSLVQDTAEVRNYIIIRYQNIEGRTVILSPDDDANLKDTASIALYGTRAEELQLDTTSTTTATNYARRYLAARKDPQWTIPGGLTVQGYIRNGSGGNVPAANVKPCERVRIENFIEDISGTGLTFLITGTAYDDEANTCNIQVGRPNGLDVWLARITEGV
ncbi:conserved hypothetical protein [Gammaproteobacteria bacterium]